MKPILILGAVIAGIAAIVSIAVLARLLAKTATIFVDHY